MIFAENLAFVITIPVDAHDHEASASNCWRWRARWVLCGE
jgi:hypothetical protein